VDLDWTRTSILDKTTLDSPFFKDIAHQPH